ncbi:MAG: glutaredoxin family protein [Pseudomonadota bacterium]|nr:glutaredoxin family protein [Pseudomonadota bacterium]
MARQTTVIVAILAATLAAGAFAQQQVYRYVDPDGRVVYSDRPPSGAAKDVQPKRLGANFIENDALPLAARQASENYPVTLYTFACGQICQTAEAMLNRRGIPFSQVNVEEAKGAERLKALTGEMTAPVLQVGDKLVAKGFNEGRWQALLDEAGYPRSMPPRTRSLAPKAPEPAPAPAAQAVPATPAGGYPKN